MLATHRKPSARRARTSSSDTSVHVRLSPPLLESIDQLAVRENRTRTNLCRVLLEEAVAARAPADSEAIRE
jgi:hypothetical protein